MLKTAFFRLTGGRPMNRLEYYFQDPAKEKPVYRFQDGLGRFWMAHSRWSIRRVKSLNHTLVP